MTSYSTLVRSTHVLTNAAWFGGSLAGAVALDGASRADDEARGGLATAEAARRRWGPAQGLAIGLHLLSGVAVVVDNRRRVVAHRPTAVAVVLKTALTGVALAVSAESYRSDAELSDALERPASDPAARQAARTLGQRMAWLRWATPVTTAGLLVLDAYLGEQQRGVPGLLDRPSRPGQPA
jgi:uncharacterized membrane protein